MRFLIQYIHLNFHSFLGFQHGSSSSVKAIMPLLATLPLAIGFKFFWFLIALLLYPKSKIFAYQTNFREDVGKSFLSVDTYIVCTPAPFCRRWGGGGVEPPTKFSKRGGGLRGPQLLEGVAGKEGVTFFREGLQFSHKK